MQESGDGREDHHEHSCEKEHPGEPHNHRHDSHDHRHDSGVSSVAIQEEGAVNPRALNEWLGQLLQERGPDMFRSKGVLCLEGEECK